MPASQFVLGRRAFFTLSDLECIEEAMYAILAGIGIEVRDEAIAARLGARGFRADGGRIRIERPSAEAFLRAGRDKSGHAFRPELQPLSPTTSRLEVGVSNYALNVHDLATDRIVPFSTEGLVEATKLADVLRPRGVRCITPGTPTDVPGPLQPVVQLHVSATYSATGRHPGDLKSLASLPYVVEMTEVLGQPLRGLTVWVFSPLALRGESLACVLAMGRKLESVGVSSMPALGSTAPIHVGDGFALAAAEVVGSAILVRELTDLAPEWSVGLFPADLASLMVVFGSPENFLLQLMTSEVNAYLHGTPWYPAAGNIHVMAKMPGVQASAERGSLMTAGALLGERYFMCAGTLSLDEVFSAEQLLYDLEIKDHVERLVRGMDGACDAERCLADVREALEAGTFAALEATARAMREVYWQPRFFERRGLAAWRAAGCPAIRRAVHDEVRRLTREHTYALPRDEQRAIDAILARAKREL